MTMNVFNEGQDKGTSAPSMLMSEVTTNNGQPDLSLYRYRVERFTLGSADEGDEAASLEALLSQSIHPDRNIVIVERKDSISATTGVYTCILIYLERRPTPPQGGTHA